MNEQDLKEWINDKFYALEKRFDSLEAKVDHLAVNLAAHEKMCAEDRGGKAADIRYTQKGLWLLAGAQLIMFGYLVFQATGFQIIGQ